MICFSIGGRPATGEATCFLRSNTVIVSYENHNAKLTRINIGDSNERYAQVVEGLKEGDRVVVQAKEILSTGQPLKIVDWESLFSQIGIE